MIDADGHILQGPVMAASPCALPVTFSAVISNKEFAPIRLVIEVGPVFRLGNLDGEVGSVTAVQLPMGIAMQAAVKPNPCVFGDALKPAKEFPFEFPVIDAAWQFSALTRHCKPYTFIMRHIRRPAAGSAAT